MGGFPEQQIRGSFSPSVMVPVAISSISKIVHNHRTLDTNQFQALAPSREGGRQLKVTSGFRPQAAEGCHPHSLNLGIKPPRDGRRLFHYRQRKPRAEAGQSPRSPGPGWAAGSLVAVFKRYNPRLHPQGFLLQV